MTKAALTVTADNQSRPYETSAGSRTKIAGGWGHVQDAKNAVAFAVDGFGRESGTYTISLDGRGQTTFRFAAPEPVADQTLTFYLHFVPTPVAVGAATSPASMLSPLSVSLDR